MGQSMMLLYEDAQPWGVTVADIGHALARTWRMTPALSGRQVTAIPDEGSAVIITMAAGDLVLSVEGTAEQQAVVAVTVAGLAPPDRRLWMLTEDAERGRILDGALDVTSVWDPEAWGEPPF